MKWYLDTEFNEDGRTIELISLGLVSERDRDGTTTEAYFINREINEKRIMRTNAWVGEHVLPKLPPRTGPQASSAWMTRAKMRAAIEALLLSDKELQLWGYFADYDWVVFCQLWGRMMDLPTSRGMPMFCHDIKQEMKRLGVEKDQLPQQDAASEHNALDDARWNRVAHEALLKYEAKQRRR